MAGKNKAPSPTCILFVQLMPLQIAQEQKTKIILRVSDVVSFDVH